MFKLQNHVPPIYVEESRDFQLLLRLYDCIDGGNKFDASTIIEVLNPIKANDRILPLLATRVGFFTDKYIDGNVLKYIIAGFPYMIKNKGTQLGVEEAVNIILKAENSLDPPVINYNKLSNTFEIATSTFLYNKTALDELLKYVLPTGTKYSTYTYSQVKSFETNLNTKSKLNVYRASDNVLSQVTEGSGTVAENYKGNLDLSQIVEEPIDDNSVDGPIVIIPKQQ